MEGFRIRQGISPAFAGNDGPGEIAAEVCVNRAGDVACAVVALLRVCVAQVEAAVKDHPIGVAEVRKQGFTVKQGWVHGQGRSEVDKQPGLFYAEKSTGICSQNPYRTSCNDAT